MFSQKTNSALNSLKFLLENNGYMLSLKPEVPNSLNCEQSLFLRDIEHYLNEDDSSSRAEKVENLISGLKTLCSKEQYFKQALLPTVYQKAHNGLPIEQDSLIRLLLTVNSIQEKVLEILFQEIMSTIQLEEENPSWLRLLLSPLKYLPNIINGEDLTEKLLDLLELSEVPMQFEVLDVLPDVLPDDCYGVAAKQLIKHLISDEKLSAAIIDTLLALNLDQEDKMEIQNIILTKILPGRLQIFPILMEYLVDNCEGGSTLTLRIRDSLDAAMASKSSPEKNAQKVLIFLKLRLFLLTRKHFARDCLNLIESINSWKDHKPIDILLLLLLHSLIKSKKRPIELIIRKKVKADTFKSELFEKSLSNMPHEVFKECFNSILEIGCSLIRKSEGVASRLFTENLFKAFFGHEFTEGIYIKEILDNLLILIGGKNKKQIDDILNIFVIFIQFNKSKLKRNVLALMRLLEQMDLFDIDGVKRVFEILCQLACDDDESTLSMRDEIHMIIRKQLSSTQRHLKFRGVIGAVIMAKHLVQVDENDEDMEITGSLELNQLPRGKIQEAAKLIGQANDRIANNYELVGLFHDQLALMLYESLSLNDNFLTWLLEVITKDFLKVYIKENFSSTRIERLKFVAQFGLNESTDGNVDVGLKAVRKEMELMTLASHFRILRLLLHKRYEGDLSSIESLLRCPVIMPQFDDVMDLEKDQALIVSDCLFHCINWFRELLNAFIRQKALRSFVIQRLKQLIVLEDQLKACLTEIPDHRLPRSYFSAASQNKQATVELKKKQPAKKLKTNESTQIDATVSTSMLTLKERKKSSSKNPDDYVMQFREIDTDLYRLLKRDLNLDHDDDGDLTIAVFLFLLKDLVKKLRVLLLGKEATESPINVIKPEDFLTDLALLLPQIHKKLLLLKKEIETDEVTNECFTLILESYSIILAWPNLSQDKNKDLLRQVLKSLKTKETSATAIVYVAAELMKDFSELTESCASINQAVYLIKIIQSLDAIAIDVKTKISLATTCEEFLKKRWENEKPNGKYIESFHYLTTVYLTKMDIKKLDELIGNILLECENLKTKEDHLESLMAVDLKTFPAFYQCLCNALHAAIQNKIKSLSNLGHLKLWKNTADSLSNLMLIAKTTKNRVNLCTFLKKSVAILKIFVSHGMPMFEIMFSNHSETIVEIMKTMQSSTRFLHQLCCDSKVKKNVSLAAHVPQFRLMLEQLVFRVKALLYANDCREAFFIGNLKNKDIDGNTQTSEEPSEAGEGEEDELPADDSSEEEEQSEIDLAEKSDSVEYD